MAGRAEKVRIPHTCAAVPHRSDRMIRRRLHEEVSEGFYYEAQQTYKATYYRYASKKAYDDAHDLLRDGTRIQLQHNQLTCGSELLNMLIQAYIQTETIVSQSLLFEVKDLLQMVAQVKDTEKKAVALELRRCAGNCLKWCKAYGSRQDTRTIYSTTGALMHQILGSNGLGQAALYLRFSCDMPTFSRVIQSSSHSCGESEIDLFAVRAVLQTLSCANKSTSVTQLQSARELWKLLTPDIPDGPLCHFVELLLASLGKLSKPLYSYACGEYKVALSRDDEFADMLGKISDAYFGSAQKGGIGKIVESLFGNG